MPDRVRPKPKLMILSCPKTGNAWLRQLLHFAYGVPTAALPPAWSDSAGSSLPEAFVGHQHLAPTEQLVRWITENDVTVLTTIRHPGDTLLSYFHYARWQEADHDRSFSQLRTDGETPGNATLAFAAGGFAQAYAISLNWARLGAIVVRYEDLAHDPVAELRTVGDRIAALPEQAITRAAVLCKPKYMSQSGDVDARHIRTARAGAWREQLSDEFVEVMAHREPFCSAGATYDYHWDRTIEPPAAFDYAAIDPFGGRECFDNGVPIGPRLAAVCLMDAAAAGTHWPDPWRIEGDSFWKWLVSPAAEASARPDLPAGTYTNLMAAMYRRRPDLQVACPDPAGADRIQYLEWFIGQAASELLLPWALVASVVEAHCQHLQGVTREVAAARALGRARGPDPTAGRPASSACRPRGPSPPSRSSSTWHGR